MNVGGQHEGGWLFKSTCEQRESEQEQNQGHNMKIKVKLIASIA